MKSEEKRTSSSPKSRCYHFLARIQGWRSAVAAPPLASVTCSGASAADARAALASAVPLLVTRWTAPAAAKAPAMLLSQDMLYEPFAGAGEAGM